MRSTMTPRQRRTYDVDQERQRLATVRYVAAVLRRMRNSLRTVGADHAASYVQRALKSTEGAIRHAEGRLTFATCKASGERKRYVRRPGGGWDVVCDECGVPMPGEIHDAPHGDHCSLNAANESRHLAAEE